MTQDNAMDKTKRNNSESAREALHNWQSELEKNVYTQDEDLMHTIQFYFPKDFSSVHATLEKFGQLVATELETAVRDNHEHLPQLESFNALGERIDQIKHHPSYVKAGDIIYGSGLLAKIASPQQFLEGLSLFFLSSQCGEAGHNCPIACSAGMLRVLQKVADFPNKLFYLEKLTSPSYQTNFTGAQFLTEIQGGSDVGQNQVYAEQDKNSQWRIYGEKWFCSNANAELIFIMARYDKNSEGTKDLGLFLIPALWENEKNLYSPNRLKDKLGTRTMATAEINFQGAYAIPMGSLEESFKLTMENVLHISRLFNSFTVVSMARRAYNIAYSYAKNRVAFSKTIIHYPLVKENLARIKSENTALLACTFATANLQQQFDLDNKSVPALLLRLLVNLLKFVTAKYSVEHIHHCLDVLAGNGTIETFSAIPRLFRDCIVCENWEGTHNTLMMQILKDMQKYQIDELYFAYIQEHIHQLNNNYPQIKLLEKSLLELQQEISQFRNLDETLQLLQIKNIVTHMAMLFAALCLLTEAIHQKEKLGSDSKLACFQYFYQIRLTHH